MRAPRVLHVPAVSAKASIAMVVMVGMVAMVPERHATQERRIEWGCSRGTNRSRWRVNRSRGCVPGLDHSRLNVALRVGPHILSHRKSAAPDRLLSRLPKKPFPGRNDQFDEPTERVESPM